MQPGLPVVRNGIDVLAAEDFAPVRYHKLALVTNHTGLTVDGRRSIDVLLEREDLQLKAIFAPEHGISGVETGEVPDGKDPTTGIPVYSLYGPRSAPTSEQLADVETVLFDIQDVGCRFYTYITTLGYVLEACAKNDVRIYVLDRPNPIGGLDVEGPSSDPACESLVAYHPLPLRHGMTLGELARLFNRERDINADLRVVTMAGWQRQYWFEHTGQRWVNPSPNIRSPVAAALYPGVGLLENTNLSVGRGTDAPFEILGAPWIDGHGLAAALAAVELAGLKVEAGSFVPEEHPFAGQQCRGVRFGITNLSEFSPADLALALVQTLRANYPEAWEFKKLDRLLARPDLLDAIEDQAEELVDLWRPDPEFFDIRARYLLC